MKTYVKNISSTLKYLMGLGVFALLTSCGASSSSSYDGIYGSRSSSNYENVETHNGTSSYYTNYFAGQKTQLNEAIEYLGGDGEDEIFTDIDGYSSSGNAIDGMDISQNEYLNGGNTYYAETDSYGAWGSNPQTVNINYYNSYPYGYYPYYNSWQYGWGWPSYYRPWSYYGYRPYWGWTWGWNWGFGFGNAGFYGNGYYGGYYGGGYYGGYHNPYYGYSNPYYGYTANNRSSVQPGRRDFGSSVTSRQGTMDRRSVNSSTVNRRGVNTDASSRRDVNSNLRNNTGTSRGSVQGIRNPSNINAGGGRRDINSGAINRGGTGVNTPTRGSVNNPPVNNRNSGTFNNTNQRSSSTPSTQQRSSTPSRNYSAPSRSSSPSMRSSSGTQSNSSGSRSSGGSSRSGGGRR